MKKQEIQDEWGKLIYEITQNKPNIQGSYPLDVIRKRELLLLAQCELGKIENEINIKFHKKIYKVIMKHYLNRKYSQ